MKELIEMLKKLHELSVKTRWLNMINKENDKYRKLYIKAQEQNFIVNELVKQYEEKFGENLRKVGK